MGKDEKCPKCGKEAKWGKKQKAEKFAVERLLKAIHVAGLDEAKKGTEGCCYECWKEGFRELMKPYAVMLGKSAEDW